jgi:protein-disulfide isomerase
MMRRWLTSALSAALLFIPGAVATAQPRPAAAQRDWTQNVVATPEGGFRMGNPNAPVKVIEYLSLACPHCAAFAEESGPRLLPNYVRTGRVSIEYRSILINAPDVAAAVLTRCAAPRAYFAMSHELLRTQPQWLERMNAVTEAQRSELRGLGPMQLVQRLVPILGLDRVAARHGITPAAQRACLSNQANLDRIEAMQTEASSRYGVTGTPTFVINGRVADTNVWSGIEPLLRAGS